MVLTRSRVSSGAFGAKFRRMQGPRWVERGARSSFESSTGVSYHRRVRPRRPINQTVRFLIRRNISYLPHHCPVAGVYKDASEERAHISPLPTKHLPSKLVILRNIGRDFGLGSVLDRHLPSVVEYPLRHKDVIGSVHDPVADKLVREGIGEALVLENSSADKQCSPGQAPTATIRYEVHLPGTFHLIHVIHRSGFPSRDNP